MRVLVNTIAHVGGGGITYLKNMLPRFAASENEYIILVPESRNILEEPDSESVWFERVSSVFDPLPARLVYEQMILPIRLRQWDVDVLFSPADLTPLLAHCPTLLAVRNPNPYFSASEFGLRRPIRRRLKFLVQRQLTKLSARKADHVFFVSEYSKDMSNHFLFLPGSKISTIYHGIDRPLFEEPSEPNDEGLRITLEKACPYLLTVSTVVEHKNYEVLLRGYARLPAYLRNQYPLLIAGRTPSESYLAELKSIIADQGIEQDVTFLGGIDYENIPWLYKQAAAYVLPSKLETFGHTLIEAMASGVPVAAADSTCLPEITGGAARLFDPDDPRELSMVIEDLLLNDEQRNKLIEAGRRRAEDFSWDNTFEETEVILDEISCRS